MQPDDVLLRVGIRGLQIDAQRGVGGVVHLVVRADQQHKGPWRRLRQYLANALYRVADACYPGYQHRAVRVVEVLVPGAALDDQAPNLAELHVRELWPLQGTDGEAHYQGLLVHEGVKRRHDGRLAADQVAGLGGQQGADDLHAMSFGMWQGRRVRVWPDGAPSMPAEQQEVRDAA